MSVPNADGTDPEDFNRYLENLEAQDNYHGNLPRSDSIVFKYMPGPKSLVSSRSGISAASISLSTGDNTVDPSRAAQHEKVLGPFYEAKIIPETWTGDDLSLHPNPSSND